MRIFNVDGISEGRLELINDFWCCWTTQFWSKMSMRQRGYGLKTSKVNVRASNTQQQFMFQNFDVGIDTKPTLSAT